MKGLQLNDGPLGEFKERKLELEVQKVKMKWDQMVPQNGMKLCK